MKALLVIAHGSRRQQSNQEVIDLAAILSKRPEHDFDIVVPAFLELADILIPDGVETCAKAGATEITVLPYFLNSGKHVTRDIPEVITAIKPQYPDIDIKVTQHIGASPVMLDLILKTASDK